MNDKTFCYWNNRYEEPAPPLTYDDREVAAVIGWGGIQVFDPAIDIIELSGEYARAVQGYSCGQCIPCRTGTRILAELFDKIRDGRGEEGDLQEIETLSKVISSASMCEVGRSSPKVFLYLLERFRGVFEAALGGRREGNGGYVFRHLLTAPCMQACPIHLDIPKYIEEIRFGRFGESLDVIQERLPLPGIVGRVCVRPCEFNCRRGLIDEPIQIKHLKRFVADCALTGAAESGEKRVGISSAGVLQSEDQGAGHGKVAIIGAGPSGLTCGRFLATMGHEVTIFEMLPEPGGMAAVGIPDYRLPREIVRREVEAIEKLGVKIIYEKALGIHFTLDDLENEGYKAIFIGMGCHCHKPLGIEGEDKGYYGYVPGVYFLRNVNLGLFDEVPKGKKMVVVGGGNVAIDCVRIAFRVGFEESHIVYRRSRKEMPADHIEIRDAQAEGVQLHFLTAPKRIISEQGRVTGLECFRMELGEPDASGRRRPVAVPGSDFIIDADVIVAAIGQEGDYSCMCNLPGVDVSPRGAILVDENLMTTRRGVFAGGDCVTGPDVLIRACAQGRRIALKIDRLLREGVVEALKEESDEKFLSSLKVFDPFETPTVPGGVKRVQITHEAPLERRKDFREVDKGYTAEEAVAEANRCLRCYRVVLYASAREKPPKS